MNEYESFYNQLDHSIWNDFEEELRYRVSRAQNEPIDDEDWFVMCAMKEQGLLSQQKRNEII